MLIPDWKLSWRFLSVQVQTLAATAALAWTALPKDEQSTILATIGIPPSLLVCGAFVAATLARLLAQPSLEKQPSEREVVDGGS